MNYLELVKQLQEKVRAEAKRRADEKAATK